MYNRFKGATLCIICFFLGSFGFLFQPVSAQNFDFDKINEQLSSYSVIIDMDIEFSFGIHNSAQKSRYLGTVVSEDGLVMFNGSIFGSSQSLPLLSGFTVKTEPVNIEVTSFDGKTYEAEYIGVDVNSNIGFLKIINPSGDKFKAVKFVSKKDYDIGSWVALYTLLPEFVSPSLAADIGLVSSVITSPEFFPMIMGFSTIQMTSVIFNEAQEPIGVLGRLSEDSNTDMDQSGFIDSPDRNGFPLLGIITPERLEKLIANPPEKGNIERGWLGISMQALTEEIAKFWDIDISGGVIVNDVMSQSPASEAGLEIGDVIYEINGDQVDVNREENLIIFRRTISELGPGTPVELSVIRIRDDIPDSIKILATLEAAPLAAMDAPEYENEILEFNVRDLVFLDYLSQNLDPETFKGVVVSELKQGGVAEVEGLQIGDVIQRIGSNDVTSVEDFEKYITEIEEAQPSEIIFFVWRNNKTLFVNVKTDWNQSE